MLLLNSKNLYRKIGFITCMLIMFTISICSVYAQADYTSYVKNRSLVDIGLDAQKASNLLNSMKKEYESILNTVPDTIEDSSKFDSILDSKIKQLDNLVNKYIEEAKDLELVDFNMLRTIPKEFKDAVYNNIWNGSVFKYALMGWFNNKVSSLDRYNKIYSALDSLDDSMQNLLYLQITKSKFEEAKKTFESKINSIVSVGAVNSDTKTALLNAYDTFFLDSYIWEYNQIDQDKILRFISTVNKAIYTEDSISEDVRAEKQINVLRYLQEKIKKSDVSNAKKTVENVLKDEYLKGTFTEEEYNSYSKSLLQNINKIEEINKNIESTLSKLKPYSGSNISENEKAKEYKQASLVRKIVRLIMWIVSVMSILIIFYAVAIIVCYAISVYMPVDLVSKVTFGNIKMTDEYVARKITVTTIFVVIMVVMHITGTMNYVITKVVEAMIKSITYLPTVK